MNNEPGMISITSATISNFDQSKQIDLLPAIVEFNVFESVSSNFITANFMIEDSLSLTTILPIVGQEVINISFKTPHEKFKDSVDLMLRVVSLENLKRSNARTSHYLLRCVSPEMIANMNTKVRKAYSNMTIDTMVAQLSQEFLGVTGIQTEECEGTRTIVIPNRTPTDSINFLCREAKSLKYPASNFKFFQNADGFHFKTLDSMIDPDNEEQPRKYLDRYFASEFSIDNQQEKVLQKTNVRPIGRYRKGSFFDTKPSEFLKILNFTFLSVGNYFKMTRMGAVQSKLRVIDPLTSYYQEHTYSYKDQSSSMRKTSTNGKSHDVLTPEADYYNQSNESRVFFLIGNKQQQNGNIEPEQKEDMFQLKMASEFLLENIVVSVEIPGDSTKRAGQTLILDFPEYGSTDDIEPEVNKYFSGEYLIASLRHVYNGSGYRTALTCVKNSYENEISNYD